MGTTRDNELDSLVLRSLIDATEPTSVELQRLLNARPTLDEHAGATALISLADVTEPTWAEEVRVIAARQVSSRDGRTATWRRVTAPSQEEIAGVCPPLPIEPLQLATTPTSLEVQRLVARLSDATPMRVGGRRTPWAVLAPALFLGAAAAATIALWPAEDTYGEPDMASGDVATISDLAIVDLGPSIDLTAHALPGRPVANVRIAQADADGTIVDVLQGGAHFEVDPKGLHRALTVLAGDVQVHVKGTVFTVDHIDNAVFVAVDRGRVQVDTPRRSFFLVAGESWSNEQTTAMALPELNVVAPTAPTAEHVIATSNLATDPVKLQEGTAPQVQPDPTPQVQPDAEPQVQPDPTPQVQPDAEPSSPEPTRITRLRDNMETLAALNRRISSNDNPLRVLSDIDSFLRSGPESRLVGVALELRLQAAERSHQTNEILASIDGLLRHTAQHPQQVALRLRSAQLHHERGDCAEAMDNYRAVSNSDSPHTSKAFIGRGLCADELGLTNEAIESIKAALNYPIEPDLRDTLKLKLRDLRHR